MGRSLSTTAALSLLELSSVLSMTSPRQLLRERTAASGAFKVQEDVASALVSGLKSTFPSLLKLRQLQRLLRTTRWKTPPPKKSRIPTRRLIPMKQRPAFVHLSRHNCRQDSFNSHHQQPSSMQFRHCSRQEPLLHQRKCDVAKNSSWA